MKFKLPLLAVSDMARAKRFYTEVFDQQIVMDFGENVTLSGGFALQSSFGRLCGFPEDDIHYGSKDGELYFEETDLDALLTRLLARDDIVFVHPMKTYPWRQRVLRIYDPDRHIIEIGEPMAAVVRRVLAEGHTLEETAAITQHPMAFIQAVKDGKDV